jgi:hypothetical protein
VKDYPRVVGEFDTIRKLLDGYSIARFGDGELKMAYGQGYVRQPGSFELMTELLSVLQKPSKKCVVGIPTMDPEGPKYQNWTRHAPRFLGVLAKRQYYSAFISRPDSSPWIRTHEYAKLVEELWKGKKTVVMCERKGSMHGAVKIAASKTVHVECPSHLAYDAIDRLYEEVVSHRPDIAILSAGPCATCLADRLSASGIQAVDLGSAGGFLRRLLK